MGTNYNNYAVYYYFNFMPAQGPTQRPAQWVPGALLRVREGGTFIIVSINKSCSKFCAEINYTIVTARHGRPGHTDTRFKTVKR
jgi:hypothetical protein